MIDSAQMPTDGHQYPNFTCGTHYTMHQDILERTSAVLGPNERQELFAVHIDQDCIITPTKMTEYHQGWAVPEYDPLIHVDSEKAIVTTAPQGLSKRMFKDATQDGHADLPFEVHTGPRAVEM